MKKQSNCFQQLERRFPEHPDMNKAYSEFMDEYEARSHMNRNTEDASSTEEYYYVPHHAVCKSSNCTLFE
jgi:transcription elongation factor Elf1